ncbi:spore germination protein [Paenibacillus sp. MWE-103]|uniref:Spore germination protein n=1 Tax=Paenibacillus artemisiicola TaxID=1172618 RepID=A0ABS3W2X2_9BACL|nr:spore germination protein [Paenibacillus artemisiicola]MBO7742625.1 spore germination protein [Paenibacillus artemisiicola]
MSFLRRLVKLALAGGQGAARRDGASPNGRAPVAAELERNLAELRRVFSHTPDLVIRTFRYEQIGRQAALIYISGLSDINAINNNILHELMRHVPGESPSGYLPVSLGRMAVCGDWSQIEHGLLDGLSVLLVDGMAHAYSMNTQGWPQRAISDSQIEASLKGAHQAFVETADSNIALIRRYLPTRELKIKEYTVGARAPSRVSLLYMEDVTEPEHIETMENRLRSLDVDAVLNTGELAELLEDSVLYFFPQFITTERPDTAASQLLQGRICVVVDRSSSVLIAPVGIVAFFHGIDDYSTRWPIASFLRMLRLFACLIAIFLPGLYIAAISFNYEIIPLDLILSIGQFRASVPFPPFLEALIMEVTLEMLREAGVRLPAPVAQTVGIVGGIVIGQAAVQAGIVSNLMVVVVATTAVASFIIPNYDMAAAIRLTRFPVMIAASLFGIVGLVACFMIIMARIITMRSLGESYSSPLAPTRVEDWKDVFVRLPLRFMVKRPRSVRSMQKKRMGTGGEGGGAP